MPERHRGGGEDAPRHVALAQPVGAHERREQDTDLARRRDVTHRREAHGGEHQNIRKRDQHGAGDGLVFMLAPLAHGLIRILDRQRREQQRSADVGAPVQQQRRDGEVADRLLVP